MKIAYLVEDVHKHGGVPRCVAELIERMVPENEVYVFSRTLEDVPAAGVHFYRIPTFGSYSLRVVTFLVATGLVLAYLTRIRRVRFDIIHSHTCNWGLFANVATFHFCSGEGLAVERQVWRSQRLPWFRFFPILNRLNRYLYRLLLLWSEQRMMQRSTVSLVAVSGHLREDCIKRFGVRGTRMCAIPLGVDTDRFHPWNRKLLRVPVRTRHGLSEKDSVLLFVGGDWDRKGLDTLFAALVSLPPQVKLLVVGAGDVDLYRRMAGTLQIGERAVFAGQAEAVEEYYAAGDIFVLPTRYEPFGLVILEAMASGLPVITSAVAGASDLIEDGVSGRLLRDPEDANELAKLITSLLSDPGLRESMSRRARRVAEEHSWDVNAAKYRTLYESVVAERQPQPSGRL